MVGIEQPFSIDEAKMLDRIDRKKDRKQMKMKIIQRIIDLRWEMDDYRAARMYGKVAEIRLEIARLEALLAETY